MKKLSEYPTLPISLYELENRRVLKQLTPCCTSRGKLSILEFFHVAMANDILNFSGNPF